MATPQQVAEATALIEQQDVARQRAVAAAIALAVARTRSFDQWYVTGAIAAWALSLANDIEVIQRNLARSTDSYLARAASVASGRPVRPVGAVEVKNLRQGITHAGAYGRVADVYRYQESLLAEPDVATAEPRATRSRPVTAEPSFSRAEGQANEQRYLAKRRELQSALDAAIERASAVAEMDTQLVVRAQSQKFMLAQPVADEQPPPFSEDPVVDDPKPERIKPKGRPRLIGYRRMVHPELSANGSCGMCIVASTRLYKRDDLMPIHNNCKCIPLPVYQGSDPGGLINETDLQRFYDEAGNNTRDELKKTRYKIDEHGELGPVLNRRGVPFRTPRQVRRDEKR